MLYIIALLPIFIYVIIIKAMDGFSMASWKKVLQGLAWGAACCGGIFTFVSLTGTDLGWASPLLEEFLKCLPLIWLICRRRVAFFAEALIYGTAIGAGFALLENTLYVSFNEGFTMGDAMIRGFGTALLHMGCTALYATLAIIISRMLEKRPFAVIAAACYAAFIPSFAIHYLYNRFMLPEFVQMFIIIVLMLSLFTMIYSIDTKLIHNWLDTCISNDVALLASIREGHLKETTAGKYLLEIRSRFNPEVFFDICVYLGLYLELSIAAKSRMILKEAEMAAPINEEVHKANIDKLTELDALRKNIGIPGLMVLAPIINPKAADDWAIGELL